MPHSTLAEDEVPTMKKAGDTLRDVLESALQVKPIGAIEPPLAPTNLPDIDRRFGTNKNEMLQLLGFNEHLVFELACRKILMEMLTSTHIGDPAFGTVWNLLDIIIVLGDRDQCATQLAFWLVEEIFETHTIEDCKRVFPYLESRRERMTSENWDKKNQVVLRGCNELLRRLSHGEDTLFYGRVLIYLFRCFPLCHRGAINLRGEFNVDNTTVYDPSPVKPIQDAESMEVDEVKTEGVTDQPAVDARITITPADQGTPINGKTAPGSTEEEKEKALDLDSLYTIFWSLQSYFSRPTQLFDPANLKLFKEGLEATILKFKEVQKEQDSRASVKNSEDPKQGTKRKRGTDEEGLIGELNPKYLTSRDLFALEISDLAFRRHILVQALIIIEFLLSLTPKAKAKVSNALKITNKGVRYDFTLPDEEASWAHKTKTGITSYLQSSADGKFYHRMIDTVLSRDKNWSFWKASHCPKFQLPSIAPQNFLSALTSASAKMKPARMPSKARDTFNISFLADADGSRMLASLRDAKRAKLPELESFERGIATAEMDMDFADEKEKEELEEKRRALVWRALRVGVREKLGFFDRVDDGKNMNALFRPPEREEDAGGEGKEVKVEGGSTPLIDGEGDGAGEVSKELAKDEMDTSPDEGGKAVAAAAATTAPTANGEQTRLSDATPMEVTPENTKTVQEAESRKDEATPAAT